LHALIFLDVSCCLGGCEILEYWQCIVLAALMSRQMAR
jgi:hypothetical protein